jgi:predicted phage terminase large subunit-like protein
MQRLHTKDLTGHLLDGSDGARWEHLSIPMEAPAEKVYIFSVSKKEYARAEGELLNPVREGPAELEEHKARLGSYGYASQFQQTPLPAGGGVFKLHWFKLWPKQDSLGNEHSPELPQFEQTVQSWDTAIKSNETNSYSVCTTWGVCSFGYFLLDVWRKHVEFPEMMHAMHDLAGQRHPQAILVENKSSGQSAIQELSRSSLPVIAINVDTDKTARARAAAPKAESGKIWIVRDAPWARLYLDELCNFPKSEFDDQVDSTSQFINWIHESSSGLMAFYNKELEKDRLDKIRHGEPILRGGVYVYFCAKAGCGEGVDRRDSFCL